LNFAFFCGLEPANQEKPHTQALAAVAFFPMAVCGTFANKI
jgi:hypothetical protein